MRYCKLNTLVNRQRFLIMKKKLIFFLVWFLAVTISLAQAQDKNLEKTLFRANKFFEIQNYEEALKLYKEVLEAGKYDPLISYRIAKSYSESTEINERIAAIPFFQSALNNGLEELPPMFYYDLGRVYFENEQLDNAINAFEKQKEYTDNKKVLSELDLRIAQARNAKTIMSRPVNISIRLLSDNVNTEYTEYNPIVSADENVMAFTSLRPSENGRDFLEEIFISYSTSGTWSVPEKVEVKTENNLGTAGLSPDGQEMIIFIGAANGGGNLYKIRRDGKKWTRPEPLDQAINSKYLETTASIAPDGRRIYFASNRPGGYGGLDIYMSESQEDKTWGRPVNMGPVINSEFDEDAPFIHPGGEMLFFTSDRPESIGGNDIFKSVRENGEWKTPQNMGYPINTVADDNYFTLIADGTRGYFSSDRKDGAGGQDIYLMDMPEDFGTIPLTMIKGRIRDAETNGPIPSKILIVDKETNEEIEYVYNPDPVTGDYLVILPPNKNYDMIIESEGFLPYTFNIDIPNQTYFYELFQKISLKTIKQFDVVVGQEIEVKNAFYNTQEEQKSAARKEHEAQLVASDSIDAYVLMSQLIEAEDQEGVDYLLELIMMNNKIDEVNFDEIENEKLQAAQRIYYYDESDESKFEQKKVGEDLVFSLPTMYVTKLAEEQKKKRASKEKPINYDPRLLLKTVKVYFGAGGSDLNEKYYPELDNVLFILREHPELGVEISGYASKEGEAEFNKQLSNKRAIEVLNYINTRGVVRRRIIAKGYGATESEESNPEESRRVELRIVDLNKQD
jgi:outer membrane protein OmpA-like peptidoglycan-associated protein